MTENQGSGADLPPEPDVVVPHPLGSGSPAEPAVGSAAEKPRPVRGRDVAPAGDDEADGREAPVEPQTPAAEEPDPQVEVQGVAATGEDDGPAPGPTTAAAAARVAPRRRTRDPLAAALIGVLTLLLGFAFAVQVRSVGEDQQYEGAREEDLVRILDELNAREERLRDQLGEQRGALQQLTSSDSQSAAALEEAQQRAEAIGILNGTIAAQGPGLVMTIRDPEDEVRVADILDAIQELRGAGAETMQIDGVRVGVSTAITGVPGSLMVDGRPVTAPYEFVVIGSPQDMETAMNIPGGVVPHISGRGGSVDIVQSDRVVVDALRPLDTPQYARPEDD
ncbi:MAG: hypothetical protein JWP33_2898 [Blastococcus sp.]|nr:hypothetical protein [Blastococcus sp.]